MAAIFFQGNCYEVQQSAKKLKCQSIKTLIINHLHNTKYNKVYAFDTPLPATPVRFRYKYKHSHTCLKSPISASFIII
ncbi:hypothetical protein SAMN05421739_102645 [Pontibacter chinhatensis]|uniref:Uncharacterized protein n=1 Tax=Pontibacter chinhatensis TaxID=1436961 RepID=A0A1I2S481_9BACT|nr:hypothetical protein SAMN05421739_102645 [Pontibacter chinhatensis]